MLDTGCEVHPVMLNQVFTFSNPTQEFQITTKHRSAAVIFIAFIEFYPLYIMIMLIINIEHHLTTHIFSIICIDADYPWSLNLGLGGRIGIHSDDWHPTFPLADVLTLTSIYWWRIPTSWYLRIRLLTSTMTFNLARPWVDPPWMIAFLELGCESISVEYQCMSLLYECHHYNFTTMYRMFCDNLNLNFIKNVYCSWHISPNPNITMIQQ